MITEKVSGGQSFLASIQNLLIFAIFNWSLNPNPIRHWSENWYPGYLDHALCSSEIHLAAAKSLEIIEICKSAFFHLRRIAKIRSYLTEEATIALVHAFITCRLDNGNALLFGLPKYQIQRLQSIQNCAARLVKRHSRFDRASPLLFELHWLPVEQRITFKILLFVFKSLNGLAPFYLSDLISTYVSSRSLRSASLSLLHVPRSNQKTYGDTAFAVAALRL